MQRGEGHHSLVGALEWVCVDGWRGCTRDAVDLGVLGDVEAGQPREAQPGELGIEVAGSVDADVSRLTAGRYPVVLVGALGVDEAGGQGEPGRRNVDDRVRVDVKNIGVADSRRPGSVGASMPGCAVVEGERFKVEQRSGHSSPTQPEQSRQWRW